MEKIKALTAEQEVQLKEFREKWLAIGRSTEPADRPRAEAAITKMYEKIGEDKPKFFWFDGPATGSMARTVLSNTNLGANLEDNLSANLRANLWDNLRANLETNLWDNLRANLWANLGDNLGDNLGWYFWGQHELAWHAWFFFPHVYLRPMHTPDQILTLTLWLEIDQSCGWWQPYRNVCFVCERPAVQQVDGDGRLHREDGPALLCRDGFPVYAWHGTRVPQQVIESPESLTIEQVRAEENAEVRRVMIERMGWEAFCDKAEMRVIHTDTLTTNFPGIPVSDLVEASARLVTTYRAGTEEAVLLEAHGLKDFEGRPLRFVRLTDPSTGRQYTIRVQHSHTRCYEAVGWTFGVSEKNYKKGRFLRQGDVFLKPLSGGPSAQYHS